ncbi:MAG: hypothetical protein KY432_11325, partial [Acidobacteria bacterium]|nr:hypothetical protein [Acidobacteriota bacterium]
VVMARFGFGSLLIAVVLVGCGSSHSPEGDAGISFDADRPDSGGPADSGPRDARVPVCGDSILDLLARLRVQYRPTIVMATHSDHAATWGDYILRVVDGRITRDQT